VQVYILVYVVDDTIYDLWGWNELEVTFWLYEVWERGRFYTRCYLEHGVLVGI
jgi:hypothetical protein